MIKSGDIWLVDFDPTVGSEQSGRRPALVISGNAMNDNFGVSIVCPLTTVIKNMAGAVILKPNSQNKLKKESEILAMHLKSISHHRFYKHLGQIDDKTRLRVINNINDILKY